MRTVAVILALFTGAAPLAGQTLDEYFQIAAENNPGLQARYKMFEAALQKAPQEGGLPDPRVAFAYFVSPSPGGPQMRMARVSLTQMFPWFGTLKAQKDAAALNAEAMYHQFLYSRNELYYKVAAAYYPLLEIDLLIAIEGENIMLLKSYETTVTARFKNGEGPMVNVLRTDLALKTAETNISVLRESRRPMEVLFNKTLNRTEESPVPIPDTLRMLMLPADYRRDSLLMNNPLLDELTMKIRANKASQRAIVKKGLPQIGLGLEYMRMGAGVRPILLLSESQSRNIFSPMVSLSIPLYRGKYKAAVAEAKLMGESYELQREEMSNMLISQYEAKLFELQKQRDLIALYDQGVATARQSLNLLFRAYGNSGEDFEETLRMQQELLSYQRMRVKALTIYEVTLAELDFITSKTR